MLVKILKCFWLSLIKLRVEGLNEEILLLFYFMIGKITEQREKDLNYLKLNPEKLGQSFILSGQSIKNNLF